MNTRQFATFGSVVALLGFSLVACAVDGTSEEPTSEGSEDALKTVNKCITVKCSAGHTCNPKTGACVPNAPVECSNVRCMSGTKNIPGLGCCLKTCGGITGARCSGTDVCVDDPTDSCDPRNGGADCGGVCTPPKEPTDCRTDGCKAGNHCSGCRGPNGGVFVCIPNGAVC